MGANQAHCLPALIAPAQMHLLDLAADVYDGPYVRGVLAEVVAVPGLLPTGNYFVGGFTVILALELDDAFDPG